MNIIARLKNAYTYGGIQEIFRKSFWSCVYTVVGKNSARKVIKAKVEYGLNKTPRSEQIIVSLTTFPARFSELDLCLKSLLIQSTKADRIIVNLGSDCDYSMLTADMKYYEKFGVEYHFDPKMNLMPHKKYFYVMQEYSESIIVTADDDVIYPIEWLEALYNSYKKNPHAVSAWRVHLMKKEKNGIAPYDTWEDQCRKIKTPSMSLIATGNSGVLYPPHCFSNKIFDVNAIKEFCLRADDIWLKCLEVYYGIPVVWVPSWQVMLPDIKSTTEEKLSNENIFTGKNDTALRQIMDYLQIEPEQFFDNIE